MRETTALDILFYYKRTGKYALNVLAGALDHDAITRAYDIQFITRHEDLIARINAAIKQGTTCLVCWSFYSPQFNQVRRELQHIRQQTGQGAIHLAGGVHATAEPGQTLQAGFDAVAVGEGEQIIVDVVISLTQQRPLESVRGIATLSLRNGNGQLHKNGRGEYIDLDHYPAAAPRYKKFGPIEITRGCIYGCRFCQTPYVNKARFRHRSVDVICDTVRHMKRHGLRDYRFISPTSLSYGSQDESVNLAAIEQLLSAIRAILGKEGRLFFGTFPSEVRPEHITEQTLALLKRYIDNDNLIIGGQSGSEHILNSSRRGHGVAEVIRAVQLTVKAGLQPNVDFLYGLPGETRKDAQATLKLALKLSDMGARIHNHTFMPLPGTPYRNQQPGNIDTQTQSQLVQLTSQGKAYGKWQGQMKVAQQLAEIRNKR
jgi:B12-binding domain/radical SAM domain protein